MFTVVFGNIAKIPTDGLPPVLFYMAGITAWNYFSVGITSTSTTFVQNANLFGKVYFPRLTMPISVIISNLIQFGIQFVFLIAFMVFYWLTGAEFSPNLYILLIPILLILMAGLALGFGIIISSLTVKYRDLALLVAFGVQLWMYATPIVYPLSSLSEKYQLILMANPLTSVIETFRFVLLGVGTFSPLNLLYSFGFMIFTLIGGVLLFNKIEQSFMDTV